MPRGQILTVGVVFAAASVLLLGYVNRVAVNLMFWDQWDFESGLFLGSAPWDFFLWQHGPHRMGLAGLEIETVANLTRWDGRIDEFVMAATLILATALLLLAKVRLTGQLEYTDCAIPLLVLCLESWPHFATVSDPATAVLPMLLLGLAASALTLRDAARRWASLLAIDAAAVYTGFAVFIGLLVPILALIEGWYDRARRTWIWLVTVISSGLLASFFIGWQPVTAVDCFTFPTSNPLDYVVFIASVYASGFGLTGDMPGALGLALGVALAAGAATLLIWFTLARGSVEYAVPALLTGYGALFAVDAAVGRVCLGIDAAYAPRYVLNMVSVSIGLYIALSLLARRRAWWQHARILVTVPVVGLTLWTNVHAAQQVVPFADTKRAARDCINRYDDLEFCSRETGFMLHAVVGPDLVQRLEFMRANRLNMFKDVPAITPMPLPTATPLPTPTPAPTPTPDLIAMCGPPDVPDDV